MPFNGFTAETDNDFPSTNDREITNEEQFNRENFISEPNMPIYLEE